MVVATSYSLLRHYWTGFVALDKPRNSEFVLRSSGFGNRSSETGKRKTERGKRKTELGVPVGFRRKRSSVSSPPGHRAPSSVFRWKPTGTPSSVFRFPRSVFRFQVFALRFPFSVFRAPFSGFRTPISEPRAPKSELRVPMFVESDNTGPNYRASVGCNYLLQVPKIAFIALLYGIINLYVFNGFN